MGNSNAVAENSLTEDTNQSEGTNALAEKVREIEGINVLALTSNVLLGKKIS